jgi:beta-N-acetylhexosaminidase
MENPGSLLITGISGTSLTPEEKEFLREEKLGGVVLFSHNFEDAAQLAELVNSLQALRDEWPMFIAVDHEGGRVLRFKKGFTQFPSMYEIAKVDSPKLTFEVHAVMGRELSACGVNVSFSPVCDVWTNSENQVIGDRSFGHDVETVEKHISAAIRGLQTNGVLACAKHFPGHGNTTKDSHYELPFIKESLDELRGRELQPFVRASKSRAEFMMMGHFMVDALDGRFPTSVSAKAYQFLREETKFTKIVITDDMEMKAIADRYSIEEAALLAVDAGADVLLYRKTEQAAKAIQSLREALKTKKLKKEKFLEKLGRVEDCKRENFKEYKPIYVPKITGAFNSLEAKKAMEIYQAFLQGKPAAP